MNNLYARTVFFVTHAERASRFYVERLGFSDGWKHQEEGRTVVCQVSLFGFELILNEADDRARNRIGKGRAFIGLEDDQSERIREHFAAHGIRADRVEWGRPTLMVKDLDDNELLFWLPRDDLTGFEIPARESGAIIHPVR